MQETRLQYFVRNFIWKFIHAIITSICPFLIRLLMIQKWGIEYLGINGLCASVLQVLNIAELGIGSAILYSMYQPMAEHNIDLINALLYLYRKIYRFLGFGIFIIGIVLMPFLRYLIRGECPTDVNLYIVFFIQLLNTVIGYITYAYWNVILQADQKINVDCMIDSIATCAMYVLQIIVICNLHNYYLYIIWLPIASLMVNIVRAYYVQKEYPLIHCEGKVDDAFLKEFYKRVFAMALSKIRTAIRYSIDSIVISANLGLILLAQYQNYYQVMLVPIIIVGIVKGAILPSLGVGVATESKEENYHTFEVYSFVSNWISMWCTVCLLCLVQNFMCLWAGEKYLLDDAIVYLICFYFYLYCISENAILVREATGVWWVGKEGAVIESLLNLILDVVFAGIWGIKGVLIATVFTILCINIPYEYGAIFKGYFGIKPWKYFKNQIVYLINCVGICILMKKVCSQFAIGSFKHLLIEAGICIILPNIIYVLLNFYRKEFKVVCHMLRSAIQMKRKGK